MSLSATHESQERDHDHNLQEQNSRVSYVKDTTHIRTSLLHHFDQTLHVRMHNSVIHQVTLTVDHHFVANQCLLHASRINKKTKKNKQTNKKTKNLHTHAHLRK